MATEPPSMRAITYRGETWFPASDLVVFIEDYHDWLKGKLEEAGTANTNYAKGGLNALLAFRSDLALTALKAVGDNASVS